MQAFLPKKLKKILAFFFKQNKIQNENILQMFSPLYIKDFLNLS